MVVGGSYRSRDADQINVCRHIEDHGDVDVDLGHGGLAVVCGG
jgi:hypothetical protein